MSNTYFKFKQFTIHHDRCAMKVGTDGVLLGAWASVRDARRILDVGTGSGLIAIQLAQRNPEARITAIEIDSDASGQAQENVSRSPRRRSSTWWFPILLISWMPCAVLTPNDVWQGIPKG